MRLPASAEPALPLEPPKFASVIEGPLFNSLPSGLTLRPKADSTLCRCSVACCCPAA